VLDADCIVGPTALGNGLVLFASTTFNTVTALGDQVAHTTRRLWSVVFVSATVQLVVLVVFQVAADWTLEIAAVAGTASRKNTDRRRLAIGHPRPLTLRSPLRKNARA